ncbi:hypothetical protein [Streptomyces violaceus]|uniref:hypothetical protein n=1 Tax=Streptomyces violaceus TaxID=1936 RepID=UPI00399D7741
MVIDGIAARLAPDDPLSVRTKALDAYAMMAGTLQLSRALADRRLADELLEQGIRNTLSPLNVEHEPARTATCRARAAQHGSPDSDGPTCAQLAGLITLRS